jgi:predicted transcriptional regulator
MKTKPKIADVLFPKVRAELLRLLFAGSQKEYYVRELMMKSGLALRTVQEELAKLRSVDLVWTWSNGYHRFYQANREHPLYPHLRHIVQGK